MIKRFLERWRRRREGPPCEDLAYAKSRTDSRFHQSVYRFYIKAGFITPRQRRAIRRDLEALEVIIDGYGIEGEF